MSLNLCDENNHGEICYEGRRCPACAAIEELRDDINQHIADIKVKEERIAQLEDEVASLSEPVIACINAVREEKKAGDIQNPT